MPSLTSHKNPAFIYDSLHMGRSSLDLYSNDVGTPFVEIKSFAAYVGGSPTNMSVGLRRLGLRSALLTAVGDDPVGDFILHFLLHENVETRFIPCKPGHRTSAVVLGIEPPDKFPLVFYRENCADLQLNIDDVIAAPVAESRLLQVAGTNLSKEPSHSATQFAVERAKAAARDVVLDIDFRPDQWHDTRAFGVAIRALLPHVDLVLGTEDEIKAAMLSDAERVQVTHSQQSDARVSGETARAIDELLGFGVKAVVEKRGQRGARVHTPEAGPVEAAGFPVQVYNVLGAGDAFGAGFLFGYLNGWDWHRSARLGNACGAIVVTKHGCANFMPTYDEVTQFAAEHGGF